MNSANSKRVCPVEMAGGLDNWIRRLLQNPQKILRPYIEKGMTVLDLGCGPGFFTTELSKMLGGSGKVIAVDLQEGMLEKLKQKIKGTALEQRIELHKCSNDTIGVTGKVDFVLAFYMLHEVPDKDKLFGELLSILKPKAKILVIEPMFHVSKESFENMIDKVKSIGLEVIDRPKVFFSRAVLLTNKRNSTTP